MLQIIDGIQIATDDYYIKHKNDGIDELGFEISIFDPAYALLWEETRLLESTERQQWTVKSIAGGSKTAKITCQLDLSDWQSRLLINYNSGTHQASTILNAVKPSGWTVTNAAQKVKRRQIEMTAPTPLKISTQICESFECSVRFDNREKTVTILYPDECTVSDAYIVETVNLRKPPEYKGKSSKLYTRLYPYGKDDLSISAVNDGEAYVECFAHTTEVICEVWKDNRYTDAQALLEDAQARVNAAAIPERSWTLDVIDLCRLNPQKWSDMKIGLHTKLRLVDKNKGYTATVQIAEEKLYPHYPEKNTVVATSAIRSVQRTVHRLTEQLNDPNSDLYQKLSTR